jgi:hypothetical protein
MKAGMRSDMIEHDEVKSRAREEKTRKMSRLTRSIQDIRAEDNSSLSMDSGSISSSESVSNTTTDPLPIQNKGDLLWIRSLSDMNFQVLELEIGSKYTKRAVIEVTTEDGIVVGTNSRLEDLVSQRERKWRMAFRSKVVGIGNAFFECNNFLRDLKQQTLLSEISEAADILEETFQARIRVMKEGVRSAQLELVVDCLSVISPVLESFNSSTTFKKLPQSDKEILRTESSMEVLLLQMLSTFEKESDSFINVGLEGHLEIGVRFSVFESNIVTAHPLLAPTLREFMYEFDDYLRHDKVVITILGLLFLFKIRPGLINTELVQKERDSLLNFLDTYITLKIKHQEWKTSYYEVSKKIHRDMVRTSNLKTLFETMAVNH